MRNFWLLIISTTLLSCANTVDTVTEEVLDGNYKVTEIPGEASIPEEVRFNFNPLGNKVSGNAGCNQFSAHYSQQGNNLEFSTPMNTRKHCMGKMELEKHILSSFEKAARLDRIGEEIVIYSNNDVPLMTLIKTD